MSRTLLHRVAVCCSVLQCVAACCSVLQCVAVCDSVLKCVAVCCSVLQCVAVCWRESFVWHETIYCSALQCVVVCCSVLQCVAVHYSCLCRCKLATMNRLLKIISLFCRISSLLKGSSAKETYNLKKPTHRSHPISLSIVLSALQTYTFVNASVCVRQHILLFHINYMEKRPWFFFPREYLPDEEMALISVFPRKKHLLI